MVSLLQLPTTPPLPGTSAVPDINVALAALAGSPKTTIASAATVDLGSSTSLFVEVTGVITITSFGNNANLLVNQFYWVRFTGALQITFNAGSMITPSGANINTAAKDILLASYLGSGNWQILAYYPAAGATVTFATEAQAEAGTSNGVSVSPQSLSQGLLTNARGYANIAGRNGGFEVWQRGTPVAVAASTIAYTADGWYISTGANQASAVTRVGGLTAASRYAAQVQRNAAQTGTAAMVFAFPLDIDESYITCGQALLLQFTVSTGANWSPTSGTLTYKVYLGQNGPPAVKRNAGAYTNEQNPISGTVNLAQGAAAATIYSAVSAALGAGPWITGEVQFTWTPVGTAGANDWFAIDDVDLRVVPAGLAAAKPAFERTPYLADLMRCQRHYETSYPDGTAPGTLGIIENTINYQQNIPIGAYWGKFVYKVAKRVLTPAVTLWSYNGVAGRCSDGTNTDYGALSASSGISAANFFVVYNNSIAILVNAGGSILMGWASDAGI